MLKLSIKADLTFGECLLEGVLDLSSKDLPEHPLRQKEPIAGIRRYPMLMIERQPAGRNNAVYVWMMLQLLIPGMEHADAADLGSQTFGITGNFDQRFSAELQQHRIDKLLVL